MAGIDDIKNPSFVIILILVIYIFIHHYIFLDDIEQIDENDDGIIESAEIKKYIERHIEKKESQPPSVKKLIKSSLSGIIRGGLMGLVIGGMDGVLVGAISLGLTNPIMVSLEHRF